jgi:hypothetical protein
MTRYLVTSLLAIAAAAVSSTAFADDITIDTTPFVSTKTRAEVQAELQQFRQAGVNPWSQSFDQLAGFRSDRSRAQVSAEYISARDQVEAMTGEDSGSEFLSQRAPAGGGSVVAGQPVNAQ